MVVNRPTYACEQDSVFNGPTANTPVACVTGSSAGPYSCGSDRDLTEYCVVKSPPPSHGMRPRLDHWNPFDSQEKKLHTSSQAVESE